MKKSTRLYLSGSVQSMFFKQFIKDAANKQNVKGFLRSLEDGRAEIFLEGETSAVDSMIEICKKGPQHAQIRNIEQKEEKFQDFKDFKILKF